MAGAVKRHTSGDGGGFVMADIHCEVTGCRFNARRRCTLAGIQIGVGPVRSAALPPSLQDTIESLTGHLRRGYGSEFLEYAAYAETQTRDAEAGAICHSFAPL